MRFECPHCESAADYRKLPAVYAQGASTISGDARGRASFFTWRIFGWPALRLFRSRHSFSATHHTVLIDGIAPPREPRPQGGNWSQLAWLGVGFATAWLVSQQFEGSLTGRFLGSVVAMAIGLTGAWQRAILQHQYRIAHELWEHALRRWKDLWYCGRCHTVSFPKDSQYAQERKHQGLPAVVHL